MRKKSFYIFISITIFLLSCLLFLNWMDYSSIKKDNTINKKELLQIENLIEKINIDIEQLQDQYLKLETEKKELIEVYKEWEIKIKNIQNPS